MKWLLATAAAVALSAAAGRGGPQIEHASVAQRPSHNELYVVAAKPDMSGTWLFQIKSAQSDERVTGAIVYAYGWMPETERAMTTHVRAGHLGAGVYRADALELDRAGWWNVKLVIASDMGTDSVAFNITLNQRAPARTAPGSRTSAPG